MGFESWVWPVTVRWGFGSDRLVQAVRSALTAGVDPMGVQVSYRVAGNLPCGSDRWNKTDRVLSHNMPNRLKTTAATALLEEIVGFEGLAFPSLAI